MDVVQCTGLCYEYKFYAMAGWRIRTMHLQSLTSSTCLFCIHSSYYFQHHCLSLIIYKPFILTVHKYLKNVHAFIICTHFCIHFYFSFSALFNTVESFKFKRGVSFHGLWVFLLNFMIMSAFCFSKKDNSSIWFCPGCKFVG